MFTPPLLVRSSLLPAFLFSAALFGAYAAVQQAERQRADEPQIQMAEDAALAMSHGEDPQHVVPRSAIPADQSLAPFGVLLDDAGHLRGSSAPFTGAIPVPPTGVVDDVRRREERRFTWRPQPGLRLAAVIRKVSGGPGGYVVVARSLRETDARIRLVATLLGIVWGGGILVILAHSFITARSRPTARDV